MTKLKIVSYPRASVLQDGSLIEMDLQGQNKERITLQFDPEALDQFLARTIQLVADARNKKHTMSGHLGVPALATVAAGAGPVAGGSHVVVHLRTKTGTDFHFGLKTVGAERSAGHITAAVAEAKRQSSQTRQ